MTLEELLKYAKAAGSGFVGSVMGWPMDTAVGAANLSRAAYGYGGHKLGLLSPAQMPEPIDPKNVPGTSARLSGLLGVGDSPGEAIAEFAGGLLSPGQKKPPKKMDWTAYHGSPHKFDKFSLDKIGTGEGAQAYGHGLYFADNPEVAKAYGETLGRGDMVKVAGKAVDKSKVDYYQQTAMNWMQTAAKRGDGSVDDAIAHATAWRDSLAQQGAKAAVESQDKAIAVLREWKAKGAEVANRPNLYKVDIDDTRAPKDAFLDWDKPLSQQTEKVQAGVRKAFRKIYGEQGARNYEAAANMPAGEVISHLSGRGPASGQMAQRTSEMLKKSGVPGIRYLDAGSRGSGGTYNTVLFDDSLVKILERQ